MKRREIKKFRVIHFLDRGYSIRRACFSSGIGRATFYRWMIQDLSFKRLVNIILSGNRITVINFKFPFIHKVYVSEL